MAFELPRALWEVSGTGSIDLKHRHGEIRSWFAGDPVYADTGAVYPPASFVILAPLIGWMDYETSRRLWALASLVGMACLAWLLARSGSHDRLERAFLIVTVFCISPTQVALGVGQMINQLLPALWLGLLLVTKREGGLREDLLGSALIVAASVKPNVFVPFGWIILFACPRWRPVALCLGGYVLLTIVGVAVRPESFSTLAAEWIANVGGGDWVGSDKGTDWMTTYAGNQWLGESYSNLHKLMWTMGFDAGYAVGSVIVLAGFGVWVFRNRRADVLTLLAVAALVTRFWTYHRVYDDALLLIPLAALSRLMWKQEGARSKTLTQVLFFANWAMLMAPAQIMAGEPPLSWMMEVTQSVLWLVTLAHLTIVARVDRFQTQLA